MSVNKYNSATGKLERIAGGLLYADAPIGTILAYGGITTPNGWLLCQGQLLNVEDYPELYAVIGTNFDRNNTIQAGKFRVPDARECVLVGYSQNNTYSAITEHDTYQLGQFKDDQLQKHGHTFQQEGGNPPSSVPINSKIIFGGAQTSAQYNTATIGKTSVIDARTGTTTHGKQLGVNYIIKAKQVAVPIDLTNAVKDLIKETTYECRGILINGYSRTITGNGHAVVTLKNGIIKIEFSAKIETNDSTPDDYTGWGLSWNLLRYNIPELPADIIPKMENSKLQYFSETGTLLTDLMGYSAIGVPSPPWWQPHKMYESGGSIGSLKASQFPVGSYIMGTVYGTYKV